MHRWLHFKGIPDLSFVSMTSSFLIFFFFVKASTTFQIFQCFAVCLFPAASVQFLLLLTYGVFSGLDLECSLDDYVNKHPK